MFRSSRLIWLVPRSRTALGLSSRGAGGADMLSSMSAVARLNCSSAATVWPERHRFSSSSSFSIFVFIRTFLSRSFS